MWNLLGIPVEDRPEPRQAPIPESPLLVGRHAEVGQKTSLEEAPPVDVVAVGQLYSLKIDLDAHGYASDQRELRQSSAILAQII